MTHRQSPIGIIDSGIGGFSVALKVQQLLPHENLLYLGDGANTPYGNHTADEILKLTRYMLKFMREHSVKALLVACNTISCLIDSFQNEMDCPVLSVVSSGAKAVADLPFKKIGIISTCFTASTNCYPDEINKISPSKDVINHGCPNLAGLIEQNLGNAAAGSLIDRDIRENLEVLVNKDHIECCVLGCTHYPLVADHINRIYPGLRLVDPARQMALELKEYLLGEDLLNNNTASGRLDIYTTKGVDEYRLKAQKVGLDPISSVNLFKPYTLT